MHVQLRQLTDTPMHSLHSVCERSSALLANSVLRQAWWHACAQHIPQNSYMQTCHTTHVAQFMWHVCTHYIPHNSYMQTCHTIHVAHATAQMHAGVSLWIVRHIWGHRNVYRVTHVHKGEIGHGADLEHIHDALIRLPAAGFRCSMLQSQGLLQRRLLILPVCPAAAHAHFF